MKLQNIERCTTNVACCVALLVTVVACGGGGSTGTGQLGKSAQVSVQMVGARSTGRGPSTVTMLITGISEQTNAYYEEEVTSEVTDGEAVLEAMVDPGDAVVTLNFVGADVDGHQVWGGAADLHEGENNVDVAPGDGDWESGTTEAQQIFEASRKLKELMKSGDYSGINSLDFRWLFLMASASNSVNMLGQCAEGNASLNFYDDLVIKTTEGTLLEEDFDHYDDNSTTLDELSPLWSGVAGYVSNLMHAPNSGPGCWVNQAMREWSRQDGIDFSLDMLPVDKRVSYEVSVFISDSNRGGLNFGFSQPFDGEYQAEIAMIVMREGILYHTDGIHSSTEPVANGFQGLAKYQPMQWYRIRVDCDFKSNTMDVYLDDQQVGSNLKMNASTPFGNNVTHFGLGMVGYWK